VSITYCVYVYLLQKEYAEFHEFTCLQSHGVSHNEDVEAILEDIPEDALEYDVKSQQLAAYFACDVLSREQSHPEAHSFWLHVLSRLPEREHCNILLSILNSENGKKR
jgi:hypothetical protein